MSTKLNREGVMAASQAMCENCSYLFIIHLINLVLFLNERAYIVHLVQRLQSDWLSHILLTYSGEYFCLSLLFLISLLFLLYMVYTLVTWSKKLISSWTYLSHAHKHDTKIQDNSRKYNWYILYKYKITLKELIFAGTNFCSQIFRTFRGN